MVPTAVLIICLSVVVFAFHSPQKIDRVLLVDDRIFVGAKNNVSLLSSSLSLLHSVSIGPITDSPLCSHDGSSCLRDARPVLTDNHVKILQLLPSGLLVCGSAKLGTCTTLSAENLALIHSGDVPVAANDIGASTVSLVVEESLLVAASSTADSPYRDPFPAVALRHFPDLFVANSGSLEGEAAVYLREEFRYSSRYITAFRHGHFVYVATVQGKRPVTKLIRFCANDTRFISYSEIELQCRSEENINFPELSAAVVDGERVIATFIDSSTRRSALCVFALSRLQLTFWYNIDRCRGGSGSVGLPHIGRDKKCTNKSRLPLAEDTCELGVGGSIEAVQVASYETEGLATALATTSGIVLMGKDSGELVKLKWRDDQQQLEKYAITKAVDGEIKGMTVKKDQLLLHTEHQITWVPLADCSSSSSCSACLLAADPLCHWCHSTASCQPAVSCSSQPVSICPLEDGLPEPSSLALGSSSFVFLPVRHLPQSEGFKYECVFGSIVSEAIWVEGGVRCAAPTSTRATGSHQKNMNLLLRTSLSTNPVVQFNYSLYDCSSMQICGECVSLIGCDWCSSKGECQLKGSCSGKTTRECPRIVSDRVSFLPADVSRDLLLPVHNAVLLPSSPLTCRILSQSSGVLFNATRKNDEVICKNLRVPPQNIANTSIQLELLQNGRPIDKTYVTVYECSLLATDCSSCAVLDPVWGCGWCSGRCSSTCKQHSAAECDRPHIVSFWPSSGPMEGGTTVTILGRDLGSSIDDVRDRVWVGGSRCPVIDYEVSRRIVCVVDRGSSAGPVRVAVGRSSKRTAESSQPFSFAEIAVFSVYPTFAPVSGGTRLSLYGQNLNAGSNASVSVGSIPCVVLERNSTTSLQCILGSASSVHSTSSIELKIDGSTTSVSATFEFRPDPVVTAVHPRKIFRSGGKLISVEGAHFDSILSARVFLLSSSSPSAEIVSEASSCQVINATLMTCISPRILYSDRTTSTHSSFPIGFSMDRVPSVRNLGPRLQMAVFPDPQLTPFHGTRVHPINQPLILNGIYLNDAAEPKDFKIFIGKERCYVTIVDAKQLVCNPPAEQPAATDENGSPVDGAPLVTVTVGTIRTELGLLEYSTPLAAAQIWAVVLILLAIFMGAIVLLFCLWRRRRSEKERDYRKIQLQMEELEHNVRKECKQAFAELHTSLSFSPEDNDGAEVVSMREFVGRLLWSDGTPHPSPSLYATSLPLTLAQFDSLLSSKQFIFALVEAADSDPTVSPQEKSLLCSLLTAALLRNFHYLSAIVTDLLRAHIAKAVHTGNGSLLFRSSESLVEKLVAKWFSIAMFPSIVDQQSAPLLQLFKALKCQTERGPVDEVTGKARYTINEAMQLREAIDSTTIDLLVMDLKGRGPFMLKVQSCDSLGQVKAKVLDLVFKGMPFSHRIASSHFDLEWHCPRRGPVLLSETDSATRRLNTLERFSVPPGALLLMTPVGTNSEQRNSAGDSGQCSWSSLERTPSATPTPPGYFHLTTPSQTIDKKKRIDDTIPKNIPEVYLTRLLTSKTTVQKFVDEVLETALFLEESAYPTPLKFLFDLLDEETVRNGIDSSHAHQWKANLYSLRLWAQLFHRPRLLFDVPPQQTVEADLTVVAQTLVDCFSCSEPSLATPGLPSSRLLFAKEVSRLRPLAADFLKRVSRQPKISEAQLAEHLTETANELSASSSTAALAELLSWVRGNGLRVAEVMSSDAGCVAARLPQRLAQIVALESPENIYCSISEYST